MGYWIEARDYRRHVAYLWVDAKAPPRDGGLPVAAIVLDLVLNELRKRRAVRR